MAKVLEEISNAVSEDSREENAVVVLKYFIMTKKFELEDYIDINGIDERNTAFGDVLKSYGDKPLSEQVMYFIWGIFKLMDFVNLEKYLSEIEEGGDDTLKKIKERIINALKKINIEVVMLRKGSRLSEQEGFKRLKDPSGQLMSKSIEIREMLQTEDIDDTVVEVSGLPVIYYTLDSPPKRVLLNWGEVSLRGKKIGGSKEPEESEELIRQVGGSGFQTPRKPGIPKNPTWQDLLKYQPKLQQVLDIYNENLSRGGKYDPAFINRLKELLEKES